MGGARALVTSLGYVEPVNYGAIALICNVSECDPLLVVLESLARLMSSFLLPKIY